MPFTVKLNHIIYEGKQSMKPKLIPFYATEIILSLLDEQIVTTVQRMVLSSTQVLKPQGWRLAILLHISLPFTPTLMSCQFNLHIRGKFIYSSSVPLKHPRQSNPCPKPG